MKAHDVLADDVHVGRPIVRSAAIRLGKARRRDVIVERIDPHVHDVARRVRHRDAPVERRARDRQIFETHLHEAHDFVAALRRQDEVGVRRVVREQLVLISREAEEIGFLLVPFDRRTRLGCEAFAVAPTSVSLSL